MDLKKSKRKYTITELVDALTTLSNELSSGRLSFRSDSFRIIEPVSFKVKQKIKDSELFYEISLHSKVIEEAKSAVISDTPKPRKGKQAQQQVVGRPQKPKKEIATLWKQAIQHISKHEPMPENLQKSLLNLCSPEMYLNKAWHDDWLDCCDKVNQCLMAMQNGDFDLAKKLNADINAGMQTCHKKYK